jgi:hypothetical protein
MAAGGKFGNIANELDGIMFGLLLDNGPGR